VEGSCQHSNDSLGSIKGRECVDHLRDASFSRTVFLGVECDVITSGIN
jgi:hypothetical protein